MTDASQAQCSMLDCGKPIKYLRMTPDLRDVMRLGCGEVVQIAHTEVRVDRALYSSQRVTVYRGQVIRSRGGWRPEPARGTVVVIREVMDECPPDIQAVVSKLLGLRHPNIIRTYAGAVDQERSCYSLVQAWVGDRTLASAYLQEEGGAAPSNEVTARTGLVLAKAIEHLHSRGIIHCDITPFNVLLAGDGTPVISDFGLAMLATSSTKPNGYTPCYAPIEMYPARDIPAGSMGAGCAVGPHTDRYMLGSTLYAVACGSDGRSVHPVTRTSVLAPPTERAGYEKGLEGSPQPPLAAFRQDIDPGLAAWIETLMSMSPEARFRSDAQMVKRISRVSHGIGRRRLIPEAQVRRLKRPIKAIAAVTAVFCLVLALRHSYTLVRAPREVPAFVAADIALMMGKKKTAARYLASVSPDCAEAHYRTGRLRERSGDMDGALQCYKKALGTDSGYGTAKRALQHARSAVGSICLQRGLQLYRLGEYYLADRQLTKAVRCGACDLDGYKALGRISERRGQIARAAGYWDCVARMSPSDVRPHYRAALLYMDSGSLNKAYHHALKARDLHAQPKPSDDVRGEDVEDLAAETAARCRRAAYLDLSRVKSTRRIYEKMVWLNRAKALQNNGRVNAALGRYSERLGDLSAGEKKAYYYEQAISYLRQALKLSKTQGAIGHDLARCENKRRR
jgi:tetratricopeptide (TPR) repeat protein